MSSLSAKIDSPQTPNDKYKTMYESLRRSNSKALWTLRKKAARLGYWKRKYGELISTIWGWTTDTVPNKDTIWVPPPHGKCIFLEPNQPGLCSTFTLPNTTTPKDQSDETLEQPKTGTKRSAKSSTSHMETADTVEPPKTPTKRSAESSNTHMDTVEPSVTPTKRSRNTKPSGNTKGLKTVTPQRKERVRTVSRRTRRRLPR